MQLDLTSASTLIKKYLSDRNNQLHSRESEVVLRALARELSEDEETWALAGLLHYLDWEQVGDDFAQHGLRTLAILQEEGYEIPEEVAHAISAHNESHTHIPRTSKLDYALAAGESVTGLIYAYALMRPEKLVGMTAKSLNKKFKDKAFAANVSRAFIADIEKISLEKSRFFELAIEALSEIADEIGL